MLVLNISSKAQSIALREDNITLSPWEVLAEVAYFGVSWRWLHIICEDLTRHHASGERHDLVMFSPATSCGRGLQSEVYLAQIKALKVCPHHWSHRSSRPTAILQSLLAENRIPHYSEWKNGSLCGQSSCKFKTCRRPSWYQ